LKRVTSVHVDTGFTFGDDAKHCAPNANLIKAEAELVFRRSGIVVSEEAYGVLDLLIAAGANVTQDAQQLRDFISTASERMPHYFTIELVGLSTGRQCAISYNFELTRYELIVGSNAELQLALLSSFEHSGVITGSVDYTHDGTKENTREAATMLANEILKVRQ